MLLKHKKGNSLDENQELPVELTEITDGKSLDELIKVTSTRYCNVYKINEDRFLSAIKKEFYKDHLIDNLHERKKDAERDYFNENILRIHNIVTQNRQALGFFTDSYDMTLEDFFINENPSLTMTRIVLQNVRDLIVHAHGHGDIDLKNIVIKEGKILLTNQFVKSYHCANDFYLFNDIEREILTAHGHPCNIAMPVDNADFVAYNYIYYLLVNTTGEERKALIEAGMENIYKTLLNDIPNKNVDEEDLREFKKTINSVARFENGEIVNHFFVRGF